MHRNEEKVVDFNSASLNYLGSPQVADRPPLEITHNNPTPLSFIRMCTCLFSVYLNLLLVTFHSIAACNRKIGGRGFVCKVLFIYILSLIILTYKNDVSHIQFFFTSSPFQDLLILKISNISTKIYCIHRLVFMGRF